MKSFSVCLLLLLAIFTAGRAQENPVHPDDPDAELLGTFTVETSLNPFATEQPAGRLGPIEEARLSPEASGQSASDNCQVSGEVVVWRTVGGRVDYILDPASVQFSGPCCEVDLMSTSEIFAQISRQGLAQGILLGLTPCPPSCSVPTLARVYTAACVQRTGSCQTTAFSPCDESLAYREYSFCCDNGWPLITELGSVGGACLAPCESTIGAGGGGGLE